MSGHDLFVGVGDSSFWQLPRPAVISSRQVDGNSRNDDSRAGVGKIMISCGVTAAFAVSSHGSLLEWGTSMYGERLSPATEAQPGELTSAAAAQTPPLDHPIAVVLPMPMPPVVGTMPPAIKLIACGAHFVVASLETGGCVSWGGGRDAKRALGRGGCGTCGPCSLSPSTPVVPPRQQWCPRGSGRPDWVADPLGLGGLTVKKLAAGDSHAIAVCGDGKAWAWGSGECGQLGSGPIPEGSGAAGGSACVPVSVRVPPTAVVRAAACGRDHSALLTSDGRVWTFGSSLHGQLGLGSVGNLSRIPTAVDALDGVGTMRMDGSFTGIASVACGAWHTAALSTTGDVYTWGWARFGALGPCPPGSGPSSGRKPRGGGRYDGGAGGDGIVDRSGDVGANMFTGSKRKAAEPKSTAVVEESEEGEVRPYPGLVDGMDALLLDGDGDGGEDDQLVSVSCGARYTLALSRKRRAFVWGQVEPPTENTGGGSTAKGKKTGSFCGSSRRGNGSGCLRGSYSTPRELRPEELLRAATAASGAARSVERVDDTGHLCCSRENSGGATVMDKVERGAGPEPAGVWSHSSEGKSGSLWRISTAGCGPWYVVFGLEKIGK